MKAIVALEQKNREKMSFFLVNSIFKTYSQSAYLRGFHPFDKILAAIRVYTLPLFTFPYFLKALQFASL